jgi:hypothetical protein
MALSGQAGCPRTEQCPLYARLLVTEGFWKQTYCHDHLRHRDCARLKIYLGGKPVPEDLLPNGRRQRGGR